MALVSMQVFVEARTLARARKFCDANVVPMGNLVERGLRLALAGKKKRARGAGRKKKAA